MLEIGDVRFRQKRGYLEASLRFHAMSPQSARETAIRRVNDALNALSFVSDQPLSISSELSIIGLQRGIGSASLSRQFTIARVLSESEATDAEILESALNQLDKSELDRSLGYYRKGLNSTDPFDSFLAFWQSIEIVVTGYTRLSRNSSIMRKVSDVFQEFFREQASEKIRIADDCRRLRNMIAHGSKPRDPA